MTAETLINRIRPHPWISKSASCLIYIREAIDYLVLPDQQSALQTQRTKPRCSRNHYGLIYCISGTRHFKCFIPENNRWYSLRSPSLESLQDQNEGKALHLRLLSLNGYIYACVQTRSPEEVGHVNLVALLMYDVGQNVWKSCCLPQDLTDSGRVVVIANNSSLYACTRQAVYRYCMEADTWEVSVKTSGPFVTPQPLRTVGILF